MIADALRGAICSGEIAPGAPLKQDEIRGRVQREPYAGERDRSVR